MNLLHDLVNLIRHLGDDAAWKAVLDDVGLRNLYVLLFAIVFVETGVVVFPFLPGDSLLFAVGTMTARQIGLNLPTVIGLLFAAAILGDNCNYWLGRTLGPKVFTKTEDPTLPRSFGSRLLNRKHLDKAQAFYEKYGRKTVVLARFVPIVRTFAPFVAGVGRMPYPTFLAFSVAGGAAWVTICVVAGYQFGQLAFVKGHFELIVLAIVAISLVPMAIEFWRARSADARGVDAVLEATTVGESPEKV